MTVDENDDPGNHLQPSAGSSVIAMMQPVQAALL